VKHRRHHEGGGNIVIAERQADDENLCLACLQQEKERLGRGHAQQPGDVAHRGVGESRHALISALVGREKYERDEKAVGVERQTFQHHVLEFVSNCSCAVPRAVSVRSR